MELNIQTDKEKVKTIKKFLEKELNRIMKDIMQTKHRNKSYIAKKLRKYRHVRSFKESLEVTGVDRNQASRNDVELYNQEMRE